MRQDKAKSPKTTRDTRTFRYITIGIRKDSPILKELESDASVLGVKQYGKLIVTRLGDYYRLINSIGFIPAAPSTELSEDGAGIEEEPNEAKANEASSVWSLDEDRLFS